MAVEPVKNFGSPQKFINEFLSKPITAIPKGSQWAVHFHNFDRILEAIENAVATERTPWKINTAAQELTKDTLQQNYGCMFCTAIDTPGDGLSVTTEGVKNLGALRTYVGGGRSDLPQMRMSFVDTNLSFADTFLRGWSLATACFGMIARSPASGKCYRDTMTCYKFVTTPKGAQITQRITFYDICCISVNNEEYNYDPSNTFKRREAQFVYHDYTIDAETDNPLITMNLEDKAQLTPWSQRLTDDGQINSNYQKYQKRRTPLSQRLGEGGQILPQTTRN